MDGGNTGIELRIIERRQWFLICSAMLVIFLLTWAVLTFSYRSFHVNADAFYIFQMQQAMRALVGLVLLFAIYTLRLQSEFNSMRRRLTSTLGPSEGASDIARA